MPRKRKPTEEEYPLPVPTDSPVSTYEIEEYLLGTILSNGSDFDTISALLAPNKFSQLANATIFEAMLKLGEKNVPIDIVTVIEELKLLQTFEKIGGVSYLNNLLTKVIYNENIGAYCKIVNDKWVLREVNRLANEVKDNLLQPGIESNRTNYSPNTKARSMSCRMTPTVATDLPKPVTSILSQR